MSALGQKQTSPHVRFMSALPPKADIAGRHLDVRFVPEADVAVHSPMSDKLQLSGSCEIIQSLPLLPPAKYGEVSPNAFAVFFIQEEFYLCRFFDREISGLGTLQDLVYENSSTATHCRLVSSIGH
jgi:deoxyribodipyrimidine photolyase-like uncharacterized protein